MSTIHTFDLSAFRQAVEERDASAQLAIYAEDAEVTLIDSVAKPSSPRVLRGRGEIGAWIEDLCGRDMTHRVQHAVQDEGAVAFTEDCRHPDGKGVICATVLELDNGLATHQIVVQAWDD